MEMDSGDGDEAVEVGLVASPVGFASAGSELWARRLDLGREGGWSVETALGSLSVRFPLGLHPEAIARMRTINPAGVSVASRMAFDHFIGQSSHSAPRECNRLVTPLLCLSSLGGTRGRSDPAKSVQKCGSVALLELTGVGKRVFVLAITSREVQFTSLPKHKITTRFLEVIYA